MSCSASLFLPGDPFAMGAVVRRALRGMGIAGADVDDLTQDVFVALHRRGVRFADDRSARAWLFQAARRVASNHRRAQRRRDQPRPLAPQPVPPPDPEQQLQRAQTLAQLDELAAQLSPDARAVLQLSDLHGLPVPAISQRLGMPLNTTYSHLRRARARLRALGLVALALVLLAGALLSMQCAAGGGNDGPVVALRSVAHVPR